MIKWLEEISDYTEDEISILGKLEDLGESLRLPITTIEEEEIELENMSFSEKVIFSLGELEQALDSQLAD